MPGLGVKPEAGGYGFDYRMAMNIPDFWIKIITERKDEEWYPSTMMVGNDQPPCRRKNDFLRRMSRPGLWLAIKPLFLD